MAMVFSSTIFLFLFLPLVLVAYFTLRSRLRNSVLIAASLVYYGWGEPGFLPVVLLSVAVNYGFGLLMAQVRAPRGRKALLALAVALDIGLLVVFKYANFFADSAGALLQRLPGSHAPFKLAPIA